MKRFIALVILFSVFYKPVNAASLYGSGDLIIERYIYNWMADYLATNKMRNKGEGHQGRGNPLFLAVSLTGKDGGSSYCPYGRQCVNDPIFAKKNCERRAKKNNRKSKCKLVFKGRMLKWGGANVKLDENADLESALAKVGVTIKGSSSKKPIQKKTKTKEKKVSKTLTGKRSLAMSWEGYNNLILGSLIFKEKDLVGSISVKLPNNDGNCKGTYALSAEKGTWSLLCDKKNMSASGTLKWNTKDGSVTGRGKDTKGKEVNFTVEGEN